MADALPTCECIKGAPLNEKLDAIYCYLYQHATSTVSLPSCECVRGYPLMDKVSAIYCALLQLNTGGGSITVSQISDMTAFWKAAVVTTPAANTFLTSNGLQAFAAVPFANISITASQISDATTFGKNVLLTNYFDPGPGVDTLIYIPGGGGGNLQFVNTPLTGAATITPVTSVSYDSGILTAIS